MALRPTSNSSSDDKKAQQQAAQDEVLLREIDDAVRQDQYADFAKQYGRPIGAVVAAGLLALAGYLFWDSRQEAALEKDSEALVGALDQLEAGNLDTSSERLDALIAEGDGAAKANAQMLKAGIAMEQGRNDEAAKLFAAVAADDNAAQAIRDLATVREVAATYDSRKPEDVIARLKALATPGGAYFGSAGEMVAMAYLKQGKRDEAGALFAQIAKDDTVPETLRSRARQMAGLLGVDAIEDVEEFVKEGLEGEGAQRAPAQQN
ncbi:MAG: tetratricopeptide repeat protein [Sphingomonadaceae bacterium]|nr:tetratricopeptide repeat protein [Sphingomonadaceae bacterium]MCP5384693.1 tetratricopeptide repeat protein [Altererythrobacter sp.]MCP5391952.1 tetratricopeptide repeat protein [Sphingomonadaceae bacterium]MCP5393887.1 tetratricopeptide repeat protein [Sphingomonadaceae bacterium]